MNLRDIKKDIEYVLGAFVEDCTVVATIKSGDAADKAYDLIEEAIVLFNELRDKINVRIEGSKKAYYEDLRKEVLAKTDALYEKLSAIVRETVGK